MGWGSDNGSIVSLLQQLILSASHSPVPMRIWGLEATRDMVWAVTDRLRSDQLSAASAAYREV